MASDAIETLLPGAASLEDGEPSGLGRALRGLGWTAVGAGTVTAASLFGGALSLVFAIGALVAGAIAIALLAIVAVVAAAALVVFAAVLVVLAVGALVIAALAGFGWLAVATGRLFASIGRGSARAARALRAPRLDYSAGPSASVSR